MKINLQAAEASVTLGNISCRLIKIVLLSMLVFFGCLTIAYAQGPDETEEESVVIPPEGQIDISFEELGYDDRPLNRDEAIRFYSLNLPENFELSPTGNYLELVTRHYPPVPDKPASLRITVNGSLLTTIPLTESNAISNVLRLDFEASLLQKGSNSLRVDLTTSETCEELGALVDAVVDDSSMFSFGYQQQPFPTDLGLYPLPFAQGGLFKVPVALILPNSPTSNELSVAATIAAGLGEASGGTIDLSAVSADDLTPEMRDFYHLIVVGESGRNDLVNGLPLPLPVDTTTLNPGQGILQEVVSPWNDLRLVLAVSSLDDEGLLKAGQALNRQARFLGMRGPVAIVIDLLPLTAEETVPLTANSFTLASLNYDDRIAYGAGRQEFGYEFNLPLGWQLEEQPYFVLKLAHADILDANESVLDLKLNGVPIGSTLLDQSNATEGELSIPLPRRLLRTGGNRLLIGIEMSLPNGDLCTDLEDQRAWTIISSESEIFLPYNALDVPPNLRLFPYPFIQNPDISRTLLVLSDQPSTTMIDYLMQLAVRLGSPLRGQDIVMNVVHASEVDQDMRKNHHVILLGRPTENELLAEVNAYLPQPFEPNSDLLKPLVLDSVAFLPDPNRDAGLLQVTPSPWDEVYTLFAITGTTNGGVELAVQALLDQTGQLNGNLAVVEPALNPFSDEPNPITTYSIDTRPTAPEEKALSNSGGISQSNVNRLANYWWR
jgi:hypothetical protein